METSKILKNFIVLEGLDGSGTTTQLERLTVKYNLHGINVFKTMEPTGGPIGKLIREALKKKINIDSRTLALLFSADRNEHIYGRDGIISHLDKGYHVISDRYFFSSIAYQSLSCDRDWVTGLNPYPLPEYLFFIDVDPAECQRRMASRASIELYEDIMLQERIIGNYSYGIELFSARGMKVYHIDGKQQPDIVCEKIWKIINPCR